MSVEKADNQKEVTPIEFSMQQERSAWIALCCVAVIAIVELIGVFYTNSLMLLTDLLHMVIDTFAYGSTIVALRYARREATYSATFGYNRIEPITVFITSLMLVAGACYLIFEGILHLFQDIRPENLEVLLFVLSTSVVMNFIAMYFLHFFSEKGSLNIKAAYLETLIDALASMSMIFTTIVMLYFPKLVWLDAVLATVIGGFMIKRAFPLVKKSFMILLEAVPEGICTKEVYKELLAIDGILNVHDVHIWALSPDVNSLTAHVVYNPEAVVPDVDLLPVIQKILDEKFNISHSTIQFELVDCHHNHHLLSS